MKWFAFSLIAFLALGGTAQAQRFSALTGGKLGNLCISSDRSSSEACTAYLDGISDSISFYQRLMPSSGEKGKLPDYVCVPGATTGVQIRQAYIGWLRQHTEAQRQPAAQAAMRALNDSFHCQGEQ